MVKMRDKLFSTCIFIYWQEKIFLTFFLVKITPRELFSLQKYLQAFYDYVFRQIELDIREIGYGDQSVNKKMKTYVNILYSIIDKIDKWEIYDLKQKINIINLYIEIKDNYEKFVEYFEKYSNYLSKITLNSFTKSVIDHKF